MKKSVIVLQDVVQVTSLLLPSKIIMFLHLLGDCSPLIGQVVDSAGPQSHSKHVGMLYI